MKKHKQSKKSNIVLYLMVLPTLTYVFIFHYLPMFGLIIAFKDYNSFEGIFGSQWTTLNGFQHFYNFLTLPNFWKLIGNTLTLSFSSIIFNTILPILLALFINEIRCKWIKRTTQTIMYAPYFISTVVIVGMLFAFTDYETGIITRIIMFFGGNQTNILESADNFTSLYVASGLWQGLGWWSIIYIGTLANVDPSLHEAAMIDGAGRLKRIWHINLPSIIPLAVIMLIMSIGNMLSVGFEKVYLMQTAGNLSASQIISTYVYQVSFKSIVPQFSYATAIGLFNSTVNIILLVIANFVSKRITDTSLW